MATATSRAAGGTPRAGLAPPPVSRGEALALAGICALALGLRMANLLQLRAHDPFFELPSLDARLYHEWAQRIAAGQWRSEQAFYNAPLYPYGLAVLYALVGPSLLVAKGAGALLGTLSCVLTWALGRRLFSPRVALGGAALVAGSRMLIFFDSTLVLAGPLVALGLLAALAVQLALERPSVGRWLGAGAAVGVGALARPNMLLFGALCAGWLPLALRAHPWKLRLGRLAAFAVGAALLVAPATLHNYAAEGDFVLVSFSGGLNLFLGNNPAADGGFRVPPGIPRSVMDDPWEQPAVYRAIAERVAQRPLRASEVSAVWAREALRFVRESPGAWLRLMLHKLDLALNAFEPWNIRSYTLTRDFSWVLRLPLLGFGVLAPLAFLGIWLTLGRWRALVPLYALLITVFGTLVVFFVLSRYRAPATPVLALFAAAGIAETARRAGSPAGRRRLALPLLATVAFAASAQRTIAVEDLSIAYYNLGNRYKTLADWPRAIESYQHSLQGKPGYLSAHNNLALAYEASGQHDEEARRAWQRVRALGEARGLLRYVERAERHLRALEARGAPAADP